MPVDFRTIIQVFVPQQVKAVLAYFSRAKNNFAGLRRKNLFQRQHQFGDFGRREIKMAKSRSRSAPGRG